VKLDQYTESEVQTLLAEDPRVTELGIRVLRLEDGLSLTGEVECAERRDMIMALVRDTFPEVRVRCDIGLTRVSEPNDVEML
jgi:hypothetical protein